MICIATGSAETANLKKINFTIDSRNPPSKCMFYMHLLSSFSRETYTGSAYLNALGHGLNPPEEEVILECDVVSLDRNYNMGGLYQGDIGKYEGYLEAEVDKTQFSVIHSNGNRLLLSAKGGNVSELIRPNKTSIGGPIPQVSPRYPKGKPMALACSKFIFFASRTLSDSIGQKLALVIQSVGRKREIKTFSDVFGIRAGCVSADPSLIGVCRFLGIDLIEENKTAGCELLISDNIVEGIGEIVNAKYMQANSIPIFTNSGKINSDIKNNELIPMLFNDGH